MASAGENILALKGERTSGSSIRSQNGQSSFWLQLFIDLLLVSACAAIANVVKTSLGPVGLDKMLVDKVGVRKIPISSFNMQF